MPSSSTGTVLTTIGICWPGAVLLLLIASAAFHQLRDFVSSISIGTHLALWVVALIPGIILVFLGERVRQQQEGHG